MRLFEARSHTKRTAMPEPIEALTEKYSRRGHPTVDESIAAQNLSFPRDPADLLANFRF
jgi:hypothetical protein